MMGFICRLFILINTFSWPSIKLNDFIVFFRIRFVFVWDAFSLSLGSSNLSLSFSRSQSQCCAFFVCIQTILMIKCSWDKNNNEITIELNFRIWKYPISLSSALINGWALGADEKNDEYTHLFVQLRFLRSHLTWEI